jgi:hypothetical protein
VKLNRRKAEADRLDQLREEFRADRAAAADQKPVVTEVLDDGETPPITPAALIEEPAVRDAPAPPPMVRPADPINRTPLQIIQAAKRRMDWNEFESKRLTDDLRETKDYRHSQRIERQLDKLDTEWRQLVAVVHPSIETERGSVSLVQSCRHALIGCPNELFKTEAARRFGRCEACDESVRTTGRLPFTTAH